MTVDYWSVRELEVVLGERFPVRDDERILGSRPGFNGRLVVSIATPRTPAATSGETGEAAATGEGPSSA